MRLKENWRKVVMSILINDSSLYEDGGSLSNDLSTASNESTVIKIKLTIQVICLEP